MEVDPNGELEKTPQGPNTPFSRLFVTPNILYRRVEGLDGRLGVGLRPDSESPGLPTGGRHRLFPVGSGVRTFLAKKIRSQTDPMAKYPRVRP